MPVLPIDARALKNWLDTGEAVLVDVREQPEHMARHIPGSMLLPLGKLANEMLPEHDGKKLVLHCKGGMRSMSACSTLQKLAPEETLYNLSGGIDAWTAAGFPVAGSGRSVFSLDRQVQLTIGLGLLLFSLLAWFVSPLFIIGTGFFGLGLTAAGLTGFCGLARLMALAPWNRTD